MWRVAVALVMVASLSLVMATPALALVTDGTTADVDLTVQAITAGERLVVQEVTLTNPTSAGNYPITVKTITVSVGAGTMVNADVASLEVWLDDGNGTLGVEDTQLGATVTSPDIVGGVNIDGDDIVIADSATERLFVVITLAATGAVDGHSLKTTLNAMDIITPDEENDGWAAEEGIETAQSFTYVDTALQASATLEPVSSPSGATINFTLTVTNEEADGNPAINEVKLTVASYGGNAVYVVSNFDVDGWSEAPEYDPHGNLHIITWTGGTIAAGAAGQDFTFDAMPPTGDGSYEWTVDTKDAELLTDSDIVTTTVDSTGPSAPDANKLVVTMNPPGTNDTISGNAGAVEGSATVKVYSDEGLTTKIGEITAEADGSFVAITIGEDNAEVWVTATDAAENESTGTSMLNDITVADPVLLLPLDSGLTSDTTPTLSWEAVVDPSGVTYSVQVDNDSNFSSPLASVSGLTGTEYTTPELYATTWYWQVKAIDGVENPSDWVGWSFEVDLTGPGAPVAAKLVVTMNTPPTADTISGNLGAVEASATVKVYSDEALTTQIGTDITAEANGSFSAIEIGDNLYAEVWVTATDEAGNEGPATSKLNDIEAPAAPDAAKLVVTENLAGTPDTIEGEAGAVVIEDPAVTVTVYSDETLETVIDSITAEADGSFTAIDIGEENAEVWVTATDDVGNESAGTSALNDIDEPAPDAALLVVTANVSPLEDTIEGLAGAVAAGITVNVYQEEALTNLIGSTTAEADGSFVAIEIGDNEYAEVWVTATDALNNQSDGTSKLNDIALAAPTISPTGTITISNPTITVVYAEVVTIDAATLTVDEDETDLLLTMSTLDDMTFYFTTSGLAASGYTISVTATDLSGNSGTNTQTFTVATEYEVALAPGLNLVSLPLVPLSTAIADVLPATGVEHVWYYDASEPDPLQRWLVYHPANIDASSLFTMQDGKAYWIEMSSPQTMTVTGTDYPTGAESPPVYQVVAGWNMVGFKSAVTLVPATYFSPSTALTWATSSPVTGYAVDPSPLNPGEGYWVYFIVAGYIVP